MTRLGAALRYVSLPKSGWLVVTRAMYYVPASCLVAREHPSRMPALVASYLFFEGVIGTSRHVLNDLHDVTDDRRRGGHWARFVTTDNAPLVRALLAVKLATAAAIIALVARPLALVAVAFVGTQLVYDRVAKPRSPLASVITVAAGYVLRGLSPFAWTAWRGHGVTAAALAAAVFAYALYQTVEWRHLESRILVERRAMLKPGATWFAALDPRGSVWALRALAAVAVASACAAAILGDAWPAVAAMTLATAVLLRFASDRQVTSLGRVARLAAVLVLAALALPEPWLRAGVIAVCLPVALEYEARVTIPRLTAVVFNPESRGTDERATS